MGRICGRTEGRGNGKRSGERDPSVRYGCTGGIWRDSGEDKKKAGRRRKLSDSERMAEAGCPGGQHGGLWKEDVMAEYGDPESVMFCENSMKLLLLRLNIFDKEILTSGQENLSGKA